MKILHFILPFIFLSCGQNDRKQKELELKERELALKEKEFALKQKDSTSNKTAQLVEDNIPKLKTKEEKWQEFFTEFKNAVSNNDKTKIISLTRNFDDGGGDYTLKQFLDNDLNSAKKDLNNGVRYLKMDDGTIDKTVKVTKNGLCFDFKNDKWSFCGFLGD